MTAPRSESRARVVQAAAALFARHGIDRVSLDEIAAAAGVHRATLHRHLPGGREELVEAVAASEADRLVAALSDLVAAAPDAATALTELLTACVVESRRSEVVTALLSEPVARRVILSPVSVSLRSRALDLWTAIVDRMAPLDPARRSLPPVADVISHLFRVLFGLIDDPDDLPSEDDVRRYVAVFVTPALLSGGAR